MKHSKEKRIYYLKLVVVHILLILFVVIVLFPLLYAFASSFKASGEILAGKNFWPEQWHPENYVKAWNEANFSQYTWNTVIYASVTMLLSVLANSMCGYVFARGEFPGKRIIYGLKTATMFLAFGSATMYPTLQILTRIHLNKSLWGLIVVSFCTGSMAFIFMARAFVLSLPKELDEAASIDGCSFMGIFFRITLPLMRPILATIAVLSFKDAWNDYLFPMIVTFSNPEKRTLAVGIYCMQQTSVSADWSKMLPGTIISALPLIVVYTFLNKYFVESLTTGAVKG